MFQQQTLYHFLSYLGAIFLLAACMPQTIEVTQSEAANSPTPTAMPIEADETGAESTLEVIATATNRPSVQQPAAPTANMDPQAVTQAFYDWYLNSTGDRSSGEFQNLLVERAYEDNPLLSEAFVARVDHLLSSFEKGGYDPFLLAQDLPETILAQSVAISGNEARVTVLRSWGPPTMDAIFAHLQQIDDIWLIDDITSTKLYEPTTDTPEGTVQRFYDWYIDAVRRRFEDDTVNIDFHNSELLTESFKQHIDDIRAEAEAEYPGLGLHYDPFLCAQDVPYHVTPDQALIDGQTAALTARTSFQDHIITVDLQETEEGWQIRNVTCTASPEATAKAFFTWYLGYIGDRSSGSFRNPLAEKAYRGHPLLSKTFVQQIDALFDEQGSIGHDPFLLAQDVPTNFSVEPGTEEGTAIVHFPFGAEYVSNVLVTMTEEGGRWQINDIRQAETLDSTKAAEDDVQLAASDEYGFSFVYPADWVLQKMSLEEAGQPDDWPVAAAWTLMPQDVAEYLSSQSTPPDPNAPIIVAPFNIEVISGDEEALARVFGDLAGEIAIPGVQADYVLQRDPGYTHVILAHPLHEDRWIVLTDWVTNFPGREAQGEVASPVWDQVLESIQFAK